MSSTGSPQALNLVGHAGYQQMAEQRWTSRVIADPQYKYGLNAQWNISSSLASKDVLLLDFEQLDPDGERWMLRAAKGSYAKTRIQGRKLRLSIVARSKQDAERERQWWVSEFPADEMAADQTVPVGLWYMTHQGPAQTSRRLTVPSWDSVRANYTAPVASQLAEVMTLRPTSAGHLLVWAGQAGVGKTSAVRTLGWEWRDWCNLQVIVDPEEFLGKAGYLMQAILSQGHESRWEPSLEEGEPGGVGPGITQDKDKWQLFVLEDAGETLTADAKQNVGQALSRLLNLTDGIVGQGLRVMVLVTTNEDLGRLHPAITRPGRCLSRIEFKAFQRSEADGWLVNHGLPVAGEAQTLAQLYARLDDRQPGASQQVGFRVELEPVP